MRGLTVMALTPTPTGFVAQFNKAFNPAKLNLYDSVAAGNGPTDVILSGPNGLVRGSLLLDPSNTTATFIRTGSSLGSSSGLLTAGDYTVVLRSAANGFVDAQGVALDGNNDGTPGDNFMTTFTVAASTSPVLAIADFAAGPDDSRNVAVPLGTGTGIPITLANAAQLTDASFDLNYDPTLLNVSAALNGPAGAFNLVSTPTGGVAHFVFHSDTALSGNVTLGQIIAQVPDAAAGQYKTEELLHLSSIVLNGANSGVLNNDGVHVAAYPGDATGDGNYSPLDASITARVGVALDTGFAAYPLLDPSIVGDLNNNGAPDSSDATLLYRRLAGFSVPQLAPLPPSLNIVATGPDPTLSLPSALQALAGSTLEVPVLIDTARPEDSPGMTEAVLALRYDPQVFNLSTSDIHLGELPLAGKGWQLRTAVNEQTGEIGIDLYSATPIESRVGGSLVTLTLHVHQNAPAGTTGLNLVTQVNPTGSMPFRTSAADAQSSFVLHPAVTDMGDAGVDSIVTVNGTAGAVLSATTPTEPSIDLISSFALPQPPPDQSLPVGVDPTLVESNWGNDEALTLATALVMERDRAFLPFQLWTTPDSLTNSELLDLAPWEPPEANARPRPEDLVLADWGFAESLAASLSGHPKRPKELEDISAETTDLGILRKRE